MYKINYTIDVENIIPFFENGADAKVDLYQNGSFDIFPINAHGYDDKIYTLYYTAYDYFECGDYKSYMDFLASCENIINIDGFELLISYK